MFSLHFYVYDIPVRRIWNSIRGAARLQIQTK